MDTLVRYLLDDLLLFENDYSDALSPRKREPKKSLASEHLALQPVSQQEFKNTNDQMFELLRTTTEKMDIVLSLIQGHRMPMVQLIPSLGSSQGAAVALQPPDSAAGGSRTACIPYTSVQNHVPTPIPDAMRYLPVAQIPDSHPLLPLPPTSSAPAGPHIAPAFPGADNPATLHAATDPSPSSSATKCPRIPNLPRRGPIPQWRRAVLDWLEGDPARNLDVPLKDWPPAWYAKETKQDMLYFMRKTIADAFIQYVVRLCS